MFRFWFALFVIAVVLSAIGREVSAQQFNILLPQPGIFIDRDPPRQAKAQGFPKLNANTSLANGLLFYAIDTGLGEYTILADTWPGPSRVVLMLVVAQAYSQRHQRDV